MIESPIRIAIARGSCRTPLTARTSLRNTALRLLLTPASRRTDSAEGSNQGIADSDVIEMMRRLR